MKEDKFLLFTRGDYCTSWKTEAVVQEQVTGRVTALVRDSRIIPLSGIMHAVTGMLIIVFFPPAAWMVSCAEKIMKKR